VAIYNSANDVALFLVPLEAVAMAVGLWSRNQWERLAAAAFLLVTVPAVGLSYSKGGWLALIAVVLVVGAFHPWRKWLAMAVVVIPGIALGASSSVRKRLGAELTSSSNQVNTLGSRMRLWESALNMLIHKPIFGGGLRGFALALKPYQDQGYNEHLLYPHNLVLNFWTETGLVGLTGFLWIVWKVIRAIRYGLKDGPHSRLMSIGLLGALAAVGIHGMVDVPYFKNDLAVVWWALLGLQLGLAKGEGEARPV
jgi:O-antigen ligase